MPLDRDGPLARGLHHGARRALGSPARARCDERARCADRVGGAPSACSASTRASRAPTTPTRSTSSARSRARSGRGRAEPPREPRARQRGAFRELADTTPALMWMTDPRAHVTFVNEGWLRFTGARDEELGDSFGLSAHPDDRDELLTRWREAFRRREEFRFEYRLMHAPRPVPTAGCSRWARRASPSGEFVGYVGLPRTSTSAARWRRRCASRGGFRDLADSAPVMMWTTDTRGFTFVNEGWLRFTGTTLAEELGSSWALGVHPDDVERCSTPGTRRSACARCGSTSTA